MKKLFLLAAPFLMLTACNEEDGQFTVGDCEVRFSCTIDEPFEQQDQLNKVVYLNHGTSARLTKKTVDGYTFIGAYDQDQDTLVFGSSEGAYKLVEVTSNRHFQYRYEVKTDEDQSEE